MVRTISHRISNTVLPSAIVTVLFFLLSSGGIRNASSAPLELQ